jgi:protein-disulfide isomerase
MPEHNDEDVSQPLQEDQPASAPGVADAPAEAGGRGRALRMGAAATIVVAAGIVLAIIVSGGGGSSANPGGGSGATPAQGVSALLAGIPQSANALGSPSAPVTMQYFGDLECSTARAFTLTTLPPIIGRWVRSGELRIDYRSLRSVSEPNIFDVQQVAALAAGMQDKLWYYLEDFYREQGREHSGYVTERYLRALAQQVPGLNLKQWSHDRQDPQLTTQVTGDEQAAYTAGLHNTPSFLIGRTGFPPARTLGESSALDPAAFNEAVQQILNSQPDHSHEVPSKVAAVASAPSRQHAANSARPSPNLGKEKQLRRRFAWHLATALALTATLPRSVAAQNNHP